MPDRVSAITLESFAALQSADGARLLEEAAGPGDPLAAVTALRKRYPAALVAAALETAELRRRAGGRIGGADRLFFTREALEQASDGRIAAHRARRYAGYESVADLGCGIGIDTLAIARHAPVTGIDLDPLRVAMAEANARSMCVSNATFRTRDYLADPPDAEAYWADPARRNAGRRITDPACYIPSLDQIIDLASGRPVGVKVSPAVAPEHIPEEAEAEFISVNGDLKEAVFWFGDLRQASRRATVLPGGHTLEPEGIEAPVGPVGAILYDPDPAVTRAGAVGDLAARLDAWQIDPRIAYMSAHTPVATPFAQTLLVEAVMPWNLKAVRRYLRGADARVEEVRKRGSAVDADTVRKALRDTGRRPVILVLTRVCDAPTAIIASRRKEATDGSTG